MMQSLAFTKKYKLSQNYGNMAPLHLICFCFVIMTHWEILMLLEVDGIDSGMLKSISI